MQDTVGEVLVAIPKPRGEGAWPWCRYYLIRLRRLLNDEHFHCQITGCPYGPYQMMGWPSSHFCELHQPPEEREWRARRLAQMREERERKIETGEWPAPGRRTFRQWLGIAGY